MNVKNQLSLWEYLKKKKTKSSTDDDWPFYVFCQHPDALVPTSYLPHDTEFQKPFIPLNYGVATYPFTLAVRSRLRHWLRDSLPDYLFPIEQQVDICSHLLFAFFYPFATEAGIKLAGRVFQNAWCDDMVEVLSKESPEILAKAWKKALKSPIKCESIKESKKMSDESESCGWSTNLNKLCNELKSYLPEAAMRRLKREYGKIAAFNERFPGPPANDDFFNSLVDEYHFMRLRLFDGFGTILSLLEEMATSYIFSEDQAESPIIKEYVTVLSEMALITNDLISTEKEFREGHMFSVVAFMHAFYALDWKGACVKAHLFYFTLLDKAEDLLAKIYSSEFGKDVQLICFLEQSKLQMAATFLGGLWMTRYNTKKDENTPYFWMHQKLFPDKHSRFADPSETFMAFNQQITAYWANVTDPFEGTERIASYKGYKKHVEKSNWQTQEFSEDLWPKKDERVGLSGPFAGYDPTQPDKNSFPEMTERFAKVYVWSGEERGWSWQRRCLHRYCEKKYGSADWLTRWQKAWMPDYIKPYYQL